MTASVEQNLDKLAQIPPLESGDRLTRHEFERCLLTCYCAAKYSRS